MRLKVIHLTQRQVVVFLFQEINVSGRDDAHQLATHFAIVCYGDATEAVASLGLKHVSHTFVGAHHHRVCDESLFITLKEEKKKGRKTNLGWGYDMRHTNNDVKRCDWLQGNSH